MLAQPALPALPALLLWWCSWSLGRVERGAAHPTGYVGRSLSSVAGPFRTVVERFERCPRSAEDEADGEAGDAYDEAVVVNVTRVSRQWGPRPSAQRITGNLTLHLPLDDAMATLLTIDKWSNNQWKRNAFIMRLPALCSALRGLGLLGAAACPAEKGVYAFQDLPADWQFAAMPQFYYGTWRAEAVFKLEGARRGCVRWLFKTAPAWPEDWPDVHALTA